MQFVKNRAGDIAIQCSLLGIGLGICYTVQFVKNRAGDITIQYSDVKNRAGDITIQCSDVKNWAAPTWGYCYTVQ